MLRFSRRRRRPSGPAATFEDAAVQERFDRDGWLVVDLLGPEELAAIDELRRRLGRAPGDAGTGLFNDTWSTDPAYKREMSTELLTIAGPALRRVAPDHRVPTLVTIVKHPGDQGAVPTHRDPTIVDEDRFRSLGMWCALDALDEAGGTLSVLTGSHGTPRTTRVHQDEANLRRDLDTDARFTPVCLRPGQALLYDHNLLHRSRAIGAGPPRVVISGPLVPSAASLRYGVQPADGPAVLLAVDDEFFVDNKLDELDLPAVLGRYPRIATLA